VAKRGQLAVGRREGEGKDSDDRPTSERFEQRGRG
jgi:hypothetical protein